MADYLSLCGKRLNIFQAESQLHVCYLGDMDPVLTCIPGRIALCPSMRHRGIYFAAVKKNETCSYIFWNVCMSPVQQWGVLNEVNSNYYYGEVKTARQSSHTTYTTWCTGVQCHPMSCKWMRPPVPLVQFFTTSLGYAKNVPHNGGMSLRNTWQLIWP